MENHDKRSKSQVREWEIANQCPPESVLNHGGVLQRDRFPYRCVYHKEAQHLKFVWRQQNKLLTPDFLYRKSRQWQPWKTSSAVLINFPFLGHSLGKDLKMSLIWTSSYHTEDLFQAKKKNKERKTLKDNLLRYWSQGSAIHSYSPRKMAKKTQVFQLSSFLLHYNWLLKAPVLFHKVLSSPSPKL